MAQGTPSREVIDALLARAEAGGPGAVRAARQAAILADGIDPARTLAALSLSARLEPIDPAPRLARARVLAEQGALDEAALAASEVLRSSVDQAARARAAFILGELSRAKGDAEAARGHYETALKLEEKLLAAQRSEPNAARWYARARGRIAELDAAQNQMGRAMSGAEGALAMLRAAAAQIGEPPVLAADIADAELRLAGLELDDNRPTSARRRLGEAIARYEALAITEPSEPHWRAVLSDAWALAAEADYARGLSAEARQAIDKALQARVKLAAADPREVWALAGVWRVRAALLAALGDNEAAFQSLAQAEQIAEQLCADNSETPTRFYVHTLLDGADHALRTGALQHAHQCAETARLRAEAFARQGDAHPAWLGELGACWDRLGECARLARAPAQTLEAFSRAAECRRMAYEHERDNPRFARGLAAALIKLADAAREAGAPESARVSLHESVTLRLWLSNTAPKDIAAAHALAVGLERLGFAALACGDAHAARGAWEDELALADRIFKADDIEGQRFRAIVESHLASLGGVDAEKRRRSALSRFDELARTGALTAAEAALRKKLWGGA